MVGGQWGAPAGGEGVFVLAVEGGELAANLTKVLVELGLFVGADADQCSVSPGSAFGLAGRLRNSASSS